eukprot:scaffold2824_cov372-Prasinococcus_capsulatus_cf.AAC.9
MKQKTATCKRHPCSRCGALTLTMLHPHTLGSQKLSALRAMFLHSRTLFTRLPRATGSLGSCSMLSYPPPCRGTYTTTTNVSVPVQHLEPLLVVVFHCNLTGGKSKGPRRRTHMLWTTRFHEASRACTLSLAMPSGTP